MPIIFKVKTVKRQELPYKDLDLADREGEVWKAVAGYEGIFSVSNFGRFRRELRQHPLTGQTYVQKILKQRLATKKHKKPNLASTSSLMVSLFINRVYKNYQAATLVGKTFLGELKKGENYSKKNKLWYDCRAENLEIKTRKQIVAELYRNAEKLGIKYGFQKANLLQSKWKRLSDGKEFTSKELKEEYNKSDFLRITRNTIKNRETLGSFWIKLPIEKYKNIKTRKKRSNLSMKQ